MSDQQCWVPGETITACGESSADKRPVTFRVEDTTCVRCLRTEQYSRAMEYSELARQDADELRRGLMEKQAHIEKLAKVIDSHVKTIETANAQWELDQGVIVELRAENLALKAWGPNQALKDAIEKSGFGSIDEYVIQRERELNEAAELNVQLESQHKLDMHQTEIDQAYIGKLQKFRNQLNVEAAALTKDIVELRAQLEQSKKLAATWERQCIPIEKDRDQWRAEAKGSDAQHEKWQRKAEGLAADHGRLLAEKAHADGRVDELSKEVEKLTSRNEIQAKRIQELTPGLCPGEDARDNRGPLSQLLPRRVVMSDEQAAADDLAYKREADRMWADDVRLSKAPEPVSDRQAEAQAKTECAQADESWHQCGEYGPCKPKRSSDDQSAGRSQEHLDEEQACLRRLPEFWKHATRKGWQIVGFIRHDTKPGPCMSPVSKCKECKCLVMPDDLDDDRLCGRCGIPF